MENNPSEKRIYPDAWKHQVLSPITRDGSGKRFSDLESSESNPDNYVVEIFPAPDPNQSKTYKHLLRGQNLSGLIDLRKNNQGKYTIWLGEKHRDLYSTAQLPDNPNANQYVIGIQVKSMRVEESLAQSCDRTPEHIKKIISAVNIALERNFPRGQ